MDIARAQPSQQKLVHIFGAFVCPISVDATDRSERWTTDHGCMKINCDVTSFICDAD